MLRSVFVIVARSIHRYPTQYIPNILGLATAFVSILTITLALEKETSYDAFHENSSQIYRVNYDETISGIEGARHLPTVGPQVAKVLKATYPEVVAATRIRHVKNSQFTYNDESFFENNLFYVDPDFLTMFSFPLREGNPATALQQPNSMVLTQEMAAKYFGEDSPINQVMIIDGDQSYKVTGVLEPIPEENSLTFDFLVPFDAFRVPAGYPVTLESWGWISFFNYVQLRDDVDPQVMEAKLVDFAKTHFEESRADKFRYRLQPFENIYFGSIHNGDFPQGNFNYVIILLAIGIAILFVSIFNFINLSIVMGTLRSRELGMKKVLGAGKVKIAMQFGLEFTLLSLMSLGFALMIFNLFLAEISMIFGLSASFLAVQWMPIATYMAIIAVLIGFIAGVYPLLLMSSSSVQHIIKGKVLSGSSSLRLRNTLIGLQFAIATALILVSMVVFDQYAFIGNKDLGFVKEQVIMLRTDRNVLSGQYNQIDHLLKQVPGVISTGISGEALDGDQGSVPFNLDEQDDERIFPINIYGIRPGWIETMGIELISGRSLLPGHQPDSLEGILINETTLNIIGYSADEALGKKASVGDIIDGEIIGVVKDFHFSSLHSEINPLALFVPRTLVDNVFVRYNVGAEAEETFVRDVASKWEEIAPDQPVDIMYLEENISSMYAKDQQFGKLIYFFCIVSIFISGVGLYGIVEFYVRRKLREVGIRKIMGATRMHIYSILTVKFLVIIVFAAGSGLLVAFVVMQQWLSNFAYQTGIATGQMLAALVLAVSVSLAIITYQVIRAVRLNPLQVIREE